MTLISNLGALPDQTCPDALKEQYPYSGATTGHSQPNTQMPSGGETGQQPSQTLHSQVTSLSANVTSLHSKVLEQSHMLNQIQSVVLSIKLDDGRSAPMINIGGAGNSQNSDAISQNNRNNSEQGRMQSKMDNSQNGSMDYENVGHTNPSDSSGVSHDLDNSTSVLEKLQSLQYMTRQTQSNLSSLDKTVSVLTSTVSVLQDQFETLQLFVDAQREISNSLTNDLKDLTRKYDEKAGLFCTNKGKSIFLLAQILLPPPNTGFQVLNLRFFGNASFCQKHIPS